MEVPAPKNISVLAKQELRLCTAFLRAAIGEWQLRTPCWFPSPLGGPDSYRKSLSKLSGNSGFPYTGEFVVRNFASTEY